MYVQEILQKQTFSSLNSILIYFSSNNTNKRVHVLLQKTSWS